MTDRHSDGVTAKEFAAEHGIAPATVRSWVRRGKIRPVDRRGRAYEYDPAELAAVFEAHQNVRRERGPGGTFRAG